MPVFAAPGFLLAGVLGMLVPLALHLIRRRPPGRSPLPTARFLAPDPRSAVRVSRPTDLLLLALRMLLILLVGAAFSRPAWLPAPEGTRTVVLLDRGAGVDRAGWETGLSAARDALLAADGTSRGELILFDSATTRISGHRLTVALFDSLRDAGPSAVRTDLAAGLREILPAARDLRGADSVRVRLISPLAASGWSPGLGVLRQAAWPGGMDITRLPLVPDTARTDAGAPRIASVVSSSGGRYVSAGLASAGFDVRPRAGSVDSAGAIVVLDGAADGASLLAAASAGTTVIVTPAAFGALPDSVLPWRGGGASSAAGGGTMWLGPELRLAGAKARSAGGPAAGTRTVAAWDDGRPAVAARRVGRGCLVAVGTALEDGDLPFQGEYPAALSRLARACDADDVAARPLDAGAIQLLRGTGPRAIAGAKLGGAGGVPLGRWLLGLALAVALAETFLAYRRRTAS